MRQIAQIPTLVSDCVIIPTNGLTVCMNCTPSGYYDHYDSAGNAGWGNRTADTVLGRTGYLLCTFAPSSVYLNRQYQISLIHPPVMQKAVFDGSNWSVFDKAGKSFSVYSPNGKSITIAEGATIRNQNLLPGVYFFRSEVKN